MKPFHPTVLLVVALACLPSACQLGGSWSGGGTLSGGATLGVPPAVNNNGGPPLYRLSSRSTANPGVITPIFISTAPTATTCSGTCVNSTAYDTTINPVGVDCYTRITDSTSFTSGKSVGNMTHSGGDNDLMSSVNGDYIGIQVSNGSVNILRLNTSGNCIQVVNTGIPAISVSGPFGFSATNNRRFYYFKNNTQIAQVDFDVNAANPVETILVNLTALNVCPGIPSGFTVGSESILSRTADDQRFSIVLAPGAQGTGYFAVVWDRTLGCSVANFGDPASITNGGSVYAFCASNCSSATPIGTLLTTTGSCWGAAGVNGIHSGPMSMDGQYFDLTITGSWSKGSCALQNVGNQHSIWQIATLNTQWATGGAPLTTAYGSHGSLGVTHIVTPSFQGPNIRLIANVTNFTQFLAPVLTQDYHCAWPHPLLDDSYPWTCGADLALHSMGTIGVSGCTSAVYCPKYPSNMVFALFPNASYPPGGTPAVFGHTFSCGQTTNINLYDVCSFKGTVNTSGTAVTWVSGDTFSSQFIKANGFKVGSSTYTIASWTDATHLVLTTSAGTQSGVPYSASGGDSTFGAQEAIGFTTQPGDAFCFASTMLHSLGNDNLGNPRADAFCIKLQ